MQNLEAEEVTPTLCARTAPGRDHHLGAALHTVGPHCCLPRLQACGRASLWCLGWAPSS
jgi:hypothetical protein